MIHVGIENSFAVWRSAARRLLTNRIRPDEVLWSGQEQDSLFGTDLPDDAAHTLMISAAFLKLAEAVACHSDPARWGLLYSLLFRSVNENRHLLEIESDPEVRSARVMEKAVGRDVHKFHAFVRFRRVEVEDGEIFVAWYEPQHFTVERATPFFARRFGEMRFSILTPKGCAHWDLRELVFSGPAERSSAPSGDAMEEHWRTYYRSIFNPFRKNVRLMKKEMPVRHWATLPEAQLIPELVREAAGHLLDVPCHDKQKVPTAYRDSRREGQAERPTENRFGS